VAVLPAHHGRADPAGRRVPAAAPGRQLLPALPVHRAGRQTAPAADAVPRVRERPGHQLRPGADPLGLPDAAGRGRPAGHRRLARPALARGVGHAGRLSGRRERLHDRVGHAVRQVAPALLAHAHGLPVVPGHLGAAAVPRADRQVAAALGQLRGCPSGVHVHRGRLDLRPDGPG
jgi:hypothetical protein